MLCEKEENNRELGKNQNFDKKTRKRENTCNMILEQKRQNHVVSFMLKRLFCGLQELLNMNLFSEIGEKEENN